MAIETVPIPTPLLDPRDGELLAAEAIERASAACPELSLNDPSSPQTVLAEAQGWHVAEVLYAINRLPEAAAVEFARLFGIELRLAAQATTTLTFTVTPPAGVEVTIPAGTLVSDGGSAAVFATTGELVLAPGVTQGSVAAVRMVAGLTRLASGTLTKLLDPVAWVTAVTNAEAVDSGSEQESVEGALERARNYQQRAERIVSARDLEAAILEDVLRGNAVMRVFEKTEDGYWGVGEMGRRVGNTTVVLMTRAGQAVSAEVRQQINALAEQFVGHVNVFVKDPVYRDFVVSANVRLTGLAAQSVTRARIEGALTSFFGVKASNIGRVVRRSEIIELIESTAGVDSIVPQGGGEILASPGADIELQPYELPRLGTVTLNFVV